MLFYKRYYDVPVYMPRLRDEDLNEFSKRLYEYLYYKLKIIRSNRCRCPDLKVIGKVVLSVRDSSHSVFERVLDNFNFCGCKVTLCQEICDLYPNRAYFKKLFFISAFILELVSAWHEREELRDLSLGPTLWLTMFRRNFENKFENEGAWKRLVKIARNFVQEPPDEFELKEKLLPADLVGAILSIRSLNPIPVDAAVDEAIASIERLQIGAMEENQPEILAQVEEFNEENQPGILAQVEEFNEENQPGILAQVEEFNEENQPGILAQVEEFNEENQPGILAQVEEFNEENQPGVLDDRPGPSGLCGIVAKTGHLGESSSGKSGEDVLHHLGDRNPRKRSRNVPSETDSGEKSDSPTPAKAMKEERDGGKSLRKRKHNSPPKSDSGKESDSVSPSEPKERKK